MSDKRNPFSKLAVSVTLTFGEWLALLSRLDGRPLSPKGLKAYAGAIGKLQSQVLAAPLANLHEGPSS